MQVAKFLYDYLGEPVEEGLGQTFATSTLMQRVLAGKDPGLVMLHLKHST